MLACCRLGPKNFMACTGDYATADDTIKLAGAAGIGESRLKKNACLRQASATSKFIWSHAAWQTLRTKTRNPGLNPISHKAGFSGPSPLNASAVSHNL